MRIERARTRRALLPLTSLVDVVFILLFFFMLASRPQDWRSLALQLAPAPGGTTVRAEAWRLELQAGGALQLDGRILTLEDALRRIATDTARPVLLQAGAGATLQDCVTALERLRLAGARVSLLGDAP